VSIPLKALVTLELDGVVYASGEWIALPDDQQSRAQGLLSYGLVEEAPAEPVKTRRRRTAG
jgi:hypothetical protein